MNILRPLLACTLAIALANMVTIELLAHPLLTVGSEPALAKRSSGRSSGGSSGSSSRSGSSSGSRSSSPRSTSSPTPRGNTGGTTRGGSFNRTPSPSPTLRSTPTQPDNRPVIIQQNTTNFELELEIENERRYAPPVPVYVPAPVYNVPSGNSDYDGRSPVQENYVPNTVQDASVPETNLTNTESSTRSGSAGADRGAIVGFLVFVLIAAGLTFLAWKFLRSKTATGELDNETVTVSKLQIGLLASAKTIQARLTQLSEEANLDSSEGLAAFAKDCALALLRQPDYWTHATASSETVKTRLEAQQMFERISLGERMKFDAETFSRQDDRVTIDDSAADAPEVDFAEYIVVTLVVGTENDKPLFDDVHSADDLEAALKTIGSLGADYLRIFELLWTPQSADDSLTADELIELYPEIVPIG